MLELKAKYIKGNRGHMGEISTKKRKMRHDCITIHTAFLIFTFQFPKLYLPSYNFNERCSNLGIWHGNILGS